MRVDSSWDPKYQQVISTYRTMGIESALGNNLMEIESGDIAGKCSRLQLTFIVERLVATKRRRRALWEMEVLRHKN